MFIKKEEQSEATRQLPRLMFEGLFVTGAGLGVLALIFEIAADAFSVAAYQTLLAIHGAGGRHEIAFLAFSALSVMLYLGVVPAYKGAAYLRPNSGGSGPLVEAIGPHWLRPLSWVGTSLFFLDAVFTIIISSISASDVLMLILPDFSAYRLFLAEAFAFFIMAVLVLMGPQRAVPIFLIGGGAFTIFTLFALGYVGFNAATRPELGDKTEDIIHRLVIDGIVTAEEEDHERSIEEGVGVHFLLEDMTEERQQEVQKIVSAVYHVSGAAFFLLFFKSMSSAMLGFSGYEVIPASGKHAAKPKWKVINTALTLAAVFLIGTGLIQLLAAWQWKIPSTEGYSTLLIEYELVFGDTGVLVIAGLLLAIILLLAQGGGYVGGAAVAANAAKLGRMPGYFTDDRVGIGVIWGASALVIPLIPSVTMVESFYAFGFVSAFIITSTTVYFVRHDVLHEAGIEPGSSEFKSLRFAALRGMIASYIMGIVLITQKAGAVPFIFVAATILTAFQIWIARGGLRHKPLSDPIRPETPHKPVRYTDGEQRARDEARQRGVANLVKDMVAAGAMLKFNVEPERVYRLISYTHNVSPSLWQKDPFNHDDEHFPEPSEMLETVYQAAYSQRQSILATVEAHSHYGIFTFINKYAHNWISHHRTQEEVEIAMLKSLFARTPFEKIWEEYKGFHWEAQPEEVWQFGRERYRWAKNQWPNISTQVTTIWTLQDLGLLPEGFDLQDVLKKL